MDDDEFYDPLARRCEQAKAWTAGSLAILLGAFVVGVQVVVAVALIGVIFWAGRWIQLLNRQRESNRLREREREQDVTAAGVDAADVEATDVDAPEAAPPSNIIQFPRQP